MKSKTNRNLQEGRGKDERIHEYVIILGIDQREEK